MLFLDVQYEPAASLVLGVFPERPDAHLEDVELAALGQRVGSPHVLVKAPELLCCFEIAYLLDVVLVSVHLLHLVVAEIREPQRIRVFDGSFLRFFFHHLESKFFINFEMTSPK